MSNSVLDLFGWLNTAFHSALVLAFLVVCFVKARAIGVPGAILLAVIGVLDLTSVCIFRVGMLILRSSHAGYSSMDTFFTATGVITVILNAASIGLAVTAFVLLRKPPQVR